MAQRIISSDAGRSSIKTVNENFNTDRLSIEARHGFIDFNKSKRSPYMMFNAKKDIIASVDNGPAIVYGKLVEVMIAPEDILYVTEDKLYLEYAINYVLVSVARMVEDGSEVVLNGNLTTNNFKYVKDFIDSIKGDHKIEFYNPSGNIISTIRFTVTHAIVIPQGQAALMSCAINDDLSTNEKYLKEGIVLDLGRRTVCALLVNMLNIKKDKSFDVQDGVGMEVLYHLIKEELFEKYDVRYSNFDIERIIVHNETVVDKNGVPINLDEIKTRAIIRVSERVKNAIIESFGEYNPKFVLLAGGGVYLLGELLKAIFRGSEILPDPVWSNAVGLEKVALKSFHRLTGGKNDSSK
jgi:hypothetical protein